MSLSRPIYQLTFCLEGIEEAVQDDLHLTMEEVQARSETAFSEMKSLRIQDIETGQEIMPRWWGLFERLHQEGWPWRVATYIAWAAQPKKYRWPETQELLARMCLGLTSDRAISTWRKRNPRIDDVIAMVQTAVVFDGLPDSFQAMLTVASTEDYKGRGDRELHYKLAGILSDKLEVSKPDGGELSQLEFNELLRLAGVNTPEALVALRERLQSSLQQPIKQSVEDEDGQDGPADGDDH
jgi:hypothetical protein